MKNSSSERKTKTHKIARNWNFIKYKSIQISTNALTQFWCWSWRNGLDYSQGWGQIRICICKYKYKYKYGVFVFVFVFDQISNHVFVFVFVFDPPYLVYLTTLTDRQTDRQTDRRTDRQTDWTSHIAAWSQLKTHKIARNWNFIKYKSIQISTNTDPPYLVYLTNTFSNTLFSWAVF